MNILFKPLLDHTNLNIREERSRYVLPILPPTQYKGIAESALLQNCRNRISRPAATPGELEGTDWKHGWYKATHIAMRPAC